jgi:hypothetical protein
MTTPMEARFKLNTLADELGTLAGLLADVERQLEPVENEYVQFIDNFDTGLWFSHVNDGAKLPSEAMRLKLARKEMDPELLGKYIGLTNSRKRLVDRIRSLKAEIEAQRSILSALKEELAGSR